MNVVYTVAKVAMVNFCHCSSLSLDLEYHRAIRNPQNKKNGVCTYDTLQILVSHSCIVHDFRFMISFALKVI